LETERDWKADFDAFITRQVALSTSLWKLENAQFDRGLYVLLSLAACNGDDLISEDTRKALELLTFLTWPEQTYRSAACQLYSHLMGEYGGPLMQFRDTNLSQLFPILSGGN
jgi:hypothetical protein